MKKMAMRAVLAVALSFVLCVSAAAARMLVPVGKVVGLSVAQGSVTVVAFDDTLGTAARDAGVQIGDEILRIDETQIDSAADLHTALNRSDGRVSVTLLRKNQEHQVSVCPAVTQNGPRLGIYIREGITGIGTVTYYDPSAGEFGALGHGISDTRGQLADMKTGTIYRASVESVRQGQVGKPGQLQGCVDPGRAIGQLRKNCAYGVYGKCETFSGEALPVGQAHEGDAEILSNISGDAVEVFSVQITKLYGPDNDNGRDMMLTVTDPALLTATGGIVAGMSGSPIIQSGKIVGAVTHVLVNDPTTGYGIFIENMLDAAS